MKYSEHFIPILIILLSILFIYFIFFQKKKEFYENLIEGINRENFKNSSEIQNEQTNSIFTKELASGSWTCEDTMIENNKVINVMKIIIGNDSNEKGMIEFPNQNYKINYIGNLFISAVDEKDSNKYITLLFDWKKKEKEFASCVIKMYDGNKILKTYQSYKIFDVNNMGGKLSRIILSKHYYDYNSIKEKYDIDTYNKYINKYKYPNQAFQMIYHNTNPPIFNNFKSFLKDNYKNKVIFYYQRVYQTIGSETLTTKLSKAYELKVINNQGTIFSKIILSNALKEENMTGIKEKSRYQLLKTRIYLYKMNRKTTKYNIDKENKVDKKDFDLKNNSDRIFSEKKVIVPDINKVKKTDTYYYQFELFKEVSMTNSKQEIEITTKELEKFIR